MSFRMCLKSMLLLCLALGVLPPFLNADGHFWFFPEKKQIPSEQFIKALKKYVKPTMNKTFPYANKNYHFNAREWRKLWQPLANLAMLAKLTKEKEYLHKARSMMMSICSYSHWGHRESPHLDVGRDALMPYIQLSLALNWLETEMSQSEVAKVKSCLLRQGNALVEALTLRRKSEWAHLQNESSRSLYLLAIYLGARHLEHSHSRESREWLLLTRYEFKNEMRKFDVTSGEQFQNYADMTQFDHGLLLYLQLEEQLKSSTGLLQNNWLKSRSQVYQSMIYPGYENVIGGVGHKAFGEFGLSHILYIFSAWYQDGMTAKVADQIAEKQMKRANGLPPWFCLTYGLNPKNLKREKEVIPELILHKSIGRSTLKSGWSKRDAMLMFRCGTPLNAKFYEKALLGEGSYTFRNSRPNQGSFDFYSRGHHIVTDLGFANLKNTHDHSTLRIDGIGQMSEGYPVFKRDAQLRKRVDCEWIAYEQLGTHTVLRAELSSAYPYKAGLKSFDRTLVWLEDNVLLVIDAIQADRERQLELTFRSLLHELQLNEAGVRQSVTGMNFTAKSFPKAKWSTGATYQRELRRRSFYAKSTVKAKEWYHVTVIGPAGYAEDLKLEKRDDGINIMISAWKYELEWRRNPKGPWLIFHKDSQLSWQLADKKIAN